MKSGEFHVVRSSTMYPKKGGKPTGEIPGKGRKESFDQTSGGRGGYSGSGPAPTLSPGATLRTGTGDISPCKGEGYHQTSNNKSYPKSGRGR
jgi:hypothetical protein